MEEDVRGGRQAHQEPFWLCPNALNDTPLIRKDGLKATVFVIASDGKLHTLNAINGEDRMPPQKFVPPFSKNWSLNWWADVSVHQHLAGLQRREVGRVCDGSAARRITPLTSSSRPTAAQASGDARAWLSARPAWCSRKPATDRTMPAAGQFPDTMLQLSVKDLKLVDYFTPANHNYLTRKDLDMGSMSPTVFSDGRTGNRGGRRQRKAWSTCWMREHIGGPDHKTPLFRSPLMANEDADFAGRGFWGAFATAEDDQKNRWLYAPGDGPAASGAKFPRDQRRRAERQHHGVPRRRKGWQAQAAPAWISRDMNLPEPPIVAGGLVFAISNGEFARQSKGNDGGLYNSAERAAKHVGHAVLYAFDATTGKELYSSGETMPGVDALQRHFDFGRQSVCHYLGFECVCVWREGVALPRLVIMAVLAAAGLAAASPAGSRFVHTDGTHIVAPDGERLLLRGINLGNWLVPEGYMWHFDKGPAIVPRDLGAAQRSDRPGRGRAILEAVSRLLHHRTGHPLHPRSRLQLRPHSVSLQADRRRHGVSAARQGNRVVPAGGTSG